MRKCLQNTVVLGSCKRGGVAVSVLSITSAVPTTQMRFYVMKKAFYVFVFIKKKVTLFQLYTDVLVRVIELASLYPSKTCY